MGDPATFLQVRAMRRMMQAQMDAQTASPRRRRPSPQMNPWVRLALTLLVVLLLLTIVL